ncbi:MAG: type I secretion system permease/ATPase [Pseudomonadota bacterium]
MNNPMQNSGEGLLRDAVSIVRGPLMGVAGLSFVSNLLMLTGPMFMMLVYDKVLASKSLPTLIALSALALLLYACYGLFEAMRTKLLARIGTSFDHRLAPRLFDATLRLPLYFGPHARKHDPLQDLATIRNFLMGSAPSALFDLPWMPIYFGFLYFVHPTLALTAAMGAVVLVIITAVKQYVMRLPTQAANQMHGASHSLLFDAKRNAEAAAAMSMGDDLCRRWGAGYVNSIALSRELSDHAGIFGAMTKTVRFVLQSAMLAVGAYLVILGEMSAGAMIAGSIILSRALAPVDQSIAQWRSYSSAWQSYKRLRTLIVMLPGAGERQHGMGTPKQKLSVRDLAIVPPGCSAATLAGVSFEIEAGDALGVIGPSGCGKSTLIRALVGAWKASRGEVRYDDVPIANYSAETLGDAIGHLPQSIELFDGTIAENIARFQQDATTEEIHAAAKLAGVHEMILSFPNGYDTPVGEGGMTLSGGQRQRIGLARAVFGNPFLIVLDEPNSNLDPLGEQSLNEAIQRMRAAGKIVVIVAHRPSAILAANKILSLRNGRAEMFGSKKQVLAALFPRVGQPHKPQAMPNSGVQQAPQITAEARPIQQQAQQQVQPQAQSHAQLQQQPTQASQAVQPIQTVTAADQLAPAPVQQAAQVSAPAPKTLELTATG